ncbi:MAG: nuclear transport factor 2 family protein [Acidobacteria bacterium]|nr:nuclear transport factor 2 family protein [Acidobacteriota bacterium]MBI3421748.1 nuclear transport factor 2 family protein [Acidobacteriota bacterium]
MRRLFTVWLFTCVACAFAFAQNADEQAVLKLEEDFRAAKINNDVAALQRVLADNFYEVNWRGEGSNRATIIQIFTNSKGRTIELSDLKVQVTGDAANVRGYQHETRPGMDAYIQFMHFCVRQQGAWRLLAVQQMPDYRAGSVTPKGWQGASNYYSIIHTDTTVKRSGQASALLKSNPTQPNDNNSAALSQQVKADAYRGQRVRLSGWMKGAVQPGGAALAWMGIRDENSESLRFSNTLDDFEFSLTPDWKRFAIALDVPANSAAIRFGAVLNGQGQIWTDDWQLEIVSDDTPTTHRTESEAMKKFGENYQRNNPAAVARQKQMFKLQLPSLPSAPVNLDFEMPGKP